MTIVSKQSITSKARKTLRSLARQGKAEARIIGSAKEGFAVAVKTGNTVRVVSDRHDKQYKAGLWGVRKLNQNPRKLMAKAA